MKTNTFTDQQIVAILREAETKTETIDALSPRGYPQT